MKTFYMMLNKKMEAIPAMFCFLFSNIIFWFLAGALAGALIALLFLKIDIILSCAVTMGSCCALIFGYVCGYIIIIRNS